MFRFFLFFFCITLSLNAQRLEFLNYQIKPNEGLPDKEIYQIIEDDDGFLWLATNSGLFKYNGVDFKHYKHSLQNNTSVFGLYLDANKRLWFNTIGEQYFYVKNDSIILFKDTPKTPTQRLRPFTVKKDSLYITYYNKIIKTSIKTKKGKTIKFNLAATGYLSKVVAINNQMCIANDSNVFKLSQINTAKKAKNYLNLPKVGVFKEFCVITTLLNNKNKFNLILKGTKISSSCFNNLQNVSINNIKTIRSSLWFFTSNGAYEYIEKNNELILRNYFLQGKSVSDAIFDKNNYLWFTTLSSGLFVVPSTSIFKIFRKNSDKLITSFKALNDSTITYIEGNRNFVKYNDKNNRVERKKLDFFNQKIFYDKKTDEILTFVREKLYIAKASGNLQKQMTYKLPVPKDIIKVNNTYLASYYNRLNVIDSNYKIIATKGGRCMQLAYNSVSKIILAGFSNGLEIGKDITSLQKVKVKNNPIFIKSIAIKPNTIKNYVVTTNNTVLEINTKHKVKKLKINPNLEINSIASDESFLWIATKSGLYKYNYATQKLKNYPTLNTVFNYDIKKVELTKNNIWFHTDDQIFKTSKNKFVDYVPTANLYFTAIKVNGKKVDATKKITTTDNSTVTINFLINGFKQNKEYNFEYKISFNSWKKIAKNNQIALSNLPYGNQQLHIRAIHKSLHHTSKKITASFSVTRPYYKQLWFIALLFFILLIFLYTLAKKILKIQSDKKVKQLFAEQQLANLQLENLRSQMNPHFIFNALNSIQEYIYTNEKQLASSYLVKFSRLIRIYLDHSRLSEITLQQEVDALKLYLYLEKDRFGGALEYTIYMDENINASRIIVPSLFIQPYVENAIKNGLMHLKEPKKLEIKFVLNITATELICEIIDNGIGREKSKIINAKKTHTSFATKANLDRVSLLNLKRLKKIRVITKDVYKTNPTGTKVSIYLPLK